MLKAVLFDLDGTLVDSIGDLADSGNFALRQAGLPTFTDEEFAQRVGNGIDVLINKLIPDQSYFDRVKRDFNAYYDEHCCVRTKAYSGMKELVLFLKAHGIRCGVVSNKPNAFTHKVVQTLYGKDTFDLISGQRDGVPRKPDPFLVNEMLQQLDVTKGEAYFVGDSEVDVQTAQNAGLTVLGVSYGYRDRSVLEQQKADYIFDTPAELEKFFENILTNTQNRG